MNELYNLARVFTPTTGTGPLNLGSAVSGYLTFAQSNVPNGATVSYGIFDGSNSEAGWGEYDDGSSGGSFTLVSGSPNGATANGVSLCDVATGADVSVGDLVIVHAAVWTQGSSYAFGASDCSQVGGTATIGTIVLAKAQEWLEDGGGYYSSVIFYAPVTGAGSLTMRTSATSLGTTPYWYTNIGAFSAPPGAVFSVEDSNGTGAAGITGAMPFPTGTVTSTGTALLVAGTAFGNNGSGLSAGGSFTIIDSHHVGDGHMTGGSAYRAVSVGTTDQAEWDLAGQSNWSAGIVVSIAAIRAATAGGPTLTRNVYRSTGAANTGLISLSGDAQVFITALAEDFASLVATPYLPLAGGTMTGTLNFQGPGGDTTHIFDDGASHIEADGTLWLNGNTAADVRVGGNLFLTLAPLAITEGGTGARTAGAALTNLGAYPASNPSGFITDNQTITLSGDIGGSGTTAITTTLPTINSNVGTFAVQTVNAKGQVTAATNLSGDVTTSGAAATLATVNSNVGTFQGLTLDAKGRVTAAANQSYLTGNQTITLSGDIAGSGTTAITTTLPTVNSNVGTFQGITIDAKGRVTAASNQSYVTGGPYLPLTGGNLTGYLSIGTPTNMPATPYPQSIYLGGSAGVITTTDGFTHIASGAVMSGLTAGSWVYSGSQMPVLLRLAGGGMDFWNAPAGTVGAAVTWTKRFEVGSGVAINMAIPNGGNAGNLYVSGALTTQANLALNSYLNAAGSGWLHLTGSGTAGLFLYSSSSNQFVWYTAANAAAGSAISFSARMTLNNVGLLTLIGTNAGYYFQDRTGSSTWAWYSTSDIARLWNGSDLLTLTTTGVLTAAVVISAGASGGSNGYIRLNAGDSAHAGYLAWFNSAGTRLGYFGFDNSQPSLTVEVGVFSVAGSLTTTGNLQSGAGRVISVASYNPSLTVWNTSAGAASGLLMDSGGTVIMGNQDGSGAYLNTWMRFTGWGIGYPAAAYGSTNLISFGWGTYPGFTGNVAVSVDNGGAAYPIASASDRRLKFDIAPATFDALTLVNALPLREFRWLDVPAPDGLKEATRPHDAPLTRVGVIAQEVAEFFPEGVVVGDDFDDKLGRVWTLEHNVMIAALIGAVQQLSARLEAVERTVH